MLANGKIVLTFDLSFVLVIELKEVSCLEPQTNRGIADAKDH